MSNYTIVLFSKIQVDTAIAYFILKKFGNAKFPDIENAPTEFWTEIPAEKTAWDLENEGYILVDFGNSRFDHHRLGPENKKISGSHLMAEFLEVEDKPELQKLLELARRDDLEGKGTISLDPIDRAFGLSGLLTALNKSFVNQPNRILSSVLPLLEGHYLQEIQKYEVLPKEFQQLKEQNKVKEFTAVQLGKILKILYIECDNPAMASFLRSRAVGADLVVQKSATGHINFISRQQLRLQLHKLARHIKLLEAQVNNLILNVDSTEELEKPGRTDGLPHWYYDTRANTLQNGGLNPQDIPPTRLKYEDIELAVKQALNIQREINSFQKNSRPNNNRYNDRRPMPKRDNYKRSHGAIIID